MSVENLKRAFDEMLPPPSARRTIERVIDEDVALIRDFCAKNKENGAEWVINALPTCNDEARLAMVEIVNEWFA